MVFYPGPRIMPLQWCCGFCLFWGFVLILACNLLLVSTVPVMFVEKFSLHWQLARMVFPSLIPTEMVENDILCWISRTQALDWESRRVFIYISFFCSYPSSEYLPCWDCLLAHLVIVMNDVIFLWICRLWLGASHQNHQDQASYCLEMGKGHHWDCLQ